MDAPRYAAAVWDRTQSQRSKPLPTAIPTPKGECIAAAYDAFACEHGAEEPDE
jgi:hypothetical protein